MPAVDTDLLLVQRGNTPFRESALSFAEYVNGQITVGNGEDIPIASAAQLGVIRVGDNLDIDAATGILSAVIPAGLAFQGLHTDPANSPPQAGIVAGNFWIWNGGDGVTLTGASYGAIQNAVINDRDRIVWAATNNWAIVRDSVGDNGILGVTGTAPIQIDGTTDPDFPDISIAEATTGGTGGGFMSQADKDKLDAIANGAEVNVDPTQAFTATADLGTLTLTPGGDTTNIPIATGTVAGLMSAADKVILDGLVATPGGVQSLTARNGITNNGTAGAPILDVNFGALPNGDAATAQVMPFDISALGDLP